MKMWTREDWKALFNGHSRIPERTVSEVCFAVIDSETTGLDPTKDRILSLGGVKIIQGRIAVRDTLEIFIAQDHFDASSVPIHGILKTGPNARIPEKQALVQLGSYLEDAVLVGHHIGFDLEMIRQAQGRHGLPPLQNIALDTGRLYRKTLLKTPLLPKKPSYSLDELAKKFDISCKDRHTALGDAYITALAFMHLLGQLNIKSDTPLRDLVRMAR
ncbi:3'-5' exonuclease [Robiginitalea sp.]|uniref:3'-5' exonuclease n=1 Tax=Robiginitalea sp. TaxID=1902411 RepID=UPI003C75A03B